MGGSAQNTLLSCKELSGKYETILVHGLSNESEMTDLEKQIVEDGIEKAKTQGVNVVPLPSLVRSIRPIKDFKALLALMWLIFKEKPDIVNTHSSKAGILGRVAAKIAFVPNIIHTPHGHVFYGHFGPFASKMFLWMEKLFSRFTDRIVALTDGEKNDYEKLSVCPSEKLLKIHSGVDVKQFMQSIGLNVVMYISAITWITLKRHLKNLNSWPLMSIKVLTSSQDILVILSHIGLPIPFTDRFFKYRQMFA